VIVFGERHLQRLAACLTDHRDPNRIDHTLVEMLRLRMFAFAAGYEDSNDCATLRHDPVFKMALGRAPESGDPLFAANNVAAGRDSTSECPLDCTAIDRSLRTPRYLIRDRDSAYGETFIRRVGAMGIRDRPIAPRSPWQNGYGERLIGSIRRDCLDHVIVFGEQHLRHLLQSYQRYYNEARTHLSLHKDTPVPRQVRAVGGVFSVRYLRWPPSGLSFRQGQRMASVRSASHSQRQRGSGRKR
jgi:hypothetical protein